MILGRARSGLYPLCPYICRSCARKQAGLPSSLQLIPKRALHRVYLQKQKNAEKEWQERAKEIRAGKRQSMLDLLESRGYVSQIAGYIYYLKSHFQANTDSTRNALNKLMTEKRIGAYVGIDPTAPSMHVGHLLPLMVLYWMYIHGYHVVSLVSHRCQPIQSWLLMIPAWRCNGKGGGSNWTHNSSRGSGLHHPKSQHGQHALPAQVPLAESRTLGEELRLQSRVGMESGAGEQQYLAQPFACYRSPPTTRARSQDGAYVGQRDVSESIYMTLDECGRTTDEIPSNSVRTRMESGDGMSFSEFMYPILQSWDWWHMYQAKNIQVQIGGSDQFGNITAGIDAINYILKHHYDPKHHIENPGLHDKPLGFTTPLLTTASGEKFGKSAGNAIWLEKDLTSTFDLYQVRHPTKSQSTIANNNSSSSSEQPTQTLSAT